MKTLWLVFHNGFSPKTITSRLDKGPRK
jgi:hypothetical protein